MRPLLLLCLALLMDISYAEEDVVVVRVDYLDESKIPEKVKEQLPKSKEEKYPTTLYFTFINDNFGLIGYPKQGFIPRPDDFGHTHGTKLGLKTALLDEYRMEISYESNLY